MMIKEQVFSAKVERLMINSKKKKMKTKVLSIINKEPDTSKKDKAIKYPKNLITTKNCK
jgi:hypothetical protein